MKDQRKGFWAGWKKLGPTTQLSIRITAWGFIITIALGVLSYIYYLDSATKDMQLTSLENQMKILSELSFAQADRDEKFQKTLEGIERQIILGTNIEWIRLRVYLKDVDAYEGNQIYFWFFKPNLFDVKMFLDLPGIYDEQHFLVKARNVHPEKYLIFDRWESHKTDINEKDEYHKLSTHGYKRLGYVIGELYIMPSDKIGALTVKDFQKSYLKILVNEKAKDNIKRIDLILNDSIFFKISPDECAIEKVKKFDDYPEGLSSKRIDVSDWFLLGIEASHTIGVGPFEINLYSHYEWSRDKDRSFN